MTNCLFIVIVLISATLIEWLVKNTEYGNHAK